MTLHRRAEPMRRAMPGWGICLAAIMLVAIALRLWRLDRQELWVDEIATWTIALQPLRDIVTSVFHTETNPPLFNVLVHAVVAVFGDSETALRLVSVVAGSLTIAVVFAAASIAANRRAGLFAAAFLAVSPSALNHSQEARAYALAGLLEALVLLGLLLALRPPSRHRFWQLAGWQLAGWPLFTLAAAACIYTHYTTVFFLACVVAGAAAYLLAVRDGSGVRRLVVSAVAIAVLASPALFEMAQLRTSALISWIPRIDARAAIDLTVASFGYRRVYAGQPWLNLFVALVWLGGVVWFARARPVVLLLGGILLGSVLLLFVVTQLATPIFIARTLFPLTSLLAILVGIGIAAPAATRYQVVLAVLVLAPGVIGCRNYFQMWRSSDRYREAALYLGHEMRPGDLSIGNPGIAYYRDKLGLHFPLQLIYFGIPRIAVAGLKAYPHDRVEPALHPGGRLYVVTLQSDAGELFGAGVQQRASEVKAFGRDVVYVFRPPSPPPGTPVGRTDTPMAGSVATRQRTP